MEFYKGRYLNDRLMGELKKLKLSRETFRAELLYLYEAKESPIRYSLLKENQMKSKLLFYKQYDFFLQRVVYIMEFSQEDVDDREFIYKTEEFSEFHTALKEFVESGKFHNINNWVLKKEENRMYKEFEEIVLNEIIRETEHIYNKVSLMDDSCDVYNSKVGGSPYMPAGYRYPTSKTFGTPLVLLAQINFEEMPFLEGFPTTGILQFFIPYDDDLYGLDYEDLLNQDNFRVIYHESIDYSADQQSAPLIELEDPDNFLLPIIYGSEYKIVFEQKKRGLPFNHPKFEELLKEKCLKYLNIEVDSSYRLLDMISEEAYEKITSEGHSIGGDPLFIQDDPREYEEKYWNKEILLFQLDTEWGEEATGKIVWGDMGCANFFIDPRDLEKKDFSNILYNWACS